MVATKQKTETVASPLKPPKAQKTKAIAKENEKAVHDSQHAAGEEKDGDSKEKDFKPTKQSAGKDIVVTATATMVAQKDSRPKKPTEAQITTALEDKDMQKKLEALTKLSNKVKNTLKKIKKNGGQTNSAVKASPQSKPKKTKSRSKVRTVLLDLYSHNSQNRYFSFSAIISHCRIFGSSR